jgi:divalent metal cation (Fe/Co/Zn/Cd) transporter
VYFGPDDVLVAADVAFEPEMDTVEIDEHITAIEDAIIDADESVSKVYIEPEE